MASTTSPPPSKPSFSPKPVCILLRTRRVTSALTWALPEPGQLRSCSNDATRCFAPPCACGTLGSSALHRARGVVPGTDGSGCCFQSRALPLAPRPDGPCPPHRKVRCFPFLWVSLTMRLLLAVALTTGECPACLKAEPVGCRGAVLLWLGERRRSSECCWCCSRCSPSSRSCAG